MENFRQHIANSVLFNAGNPPANGVYYRKSWQYFARQHRIEKVEYSTTEGWLTPLFKGCNYIGWAEVETVEEETKL